MSYGSLGQMVGYDTSYNPKLLFPIERAPKRQLMGIDGSKLPFYGLDMWQHYEVSWLNQVGKPCIALGQIIYDASSPYLIESKSLKLYFNALNQTQFENIKAVQACIQSDLEAVLKTKVTVRLSESSQWQPCELLAHFDGNCVDELDVPCSVYDIDANLLQVESKAVQGILCSDLLRSNCPVTNQPDWGSVQVSYTGPKISEASFLQYVVSFRNHQGFHEQCIEQMFLDIMSHCKPTKLCVYGKYTRRGGIDINPIRASYPLAHESMIQNTNLMRQ